MVTELWLYISIIYSAFPYCIFNNFVHVCLFVFFNLFSNIHSLLAGWFSRNCCAKPSRVSACLVVQIKSCSGPCEQLITATFLTWVDLTADFRYGPWRLSRECCCAHVGPPCGEELALALAYALVMEAASIPVFVWSWPHGCFKCTVLLMFTPPHPTPQKHHISTAHNLQIHFYFRAITKDTYQPQ